MACAVFLLHLVVSDCLMSSVNTFNIASIHIMAETDNPPLWREVFAELIQPCTYVVLTV